MGSVHTVFTVSQVFAAPLGSRPNVQAEQGSPTKATSSFTWVSGVQMGRKRQKARCQAAIHLPLQRLTPPHRSGAPPSPA